MPGENTLVVCSLFAALGELNLILSGLLGFSGAVLGNNTGFAIGHYAGRKVIVKWGKYNFPTSTRLKNRNITLKKERVYNGSSKVYTGTQTV
jgi:membrane protein DedA with SNARE-associated domain